MMHGPSLGLSLAERNGAAPAGGSAADTPAAATGPGWLGAAGGRWVQAVTHTIATTRPVTNAALCVTLACRTCSHIGHNAADRAAGNMTWFTFRPATVSHC